MAQQKTAPPARSVTQWLAMAKRRSKKINVVPGDVFIVPLADGTQGVAQVIEVIAELAAALCAFYAYRVNAQAVAAATFDFARADIVTVTPMSLLALVSGEWPILHNAPVAHADLSRKLDPLRASGYVGLVMANAKAMASLMNAHHGLGPWEIGTDRDFLRRLVSRP